MARLMIDPTNQIVTFKTTTAYLELLNSLHGGNDSVVLPDGTYTVTLKSGTGTMVSSTPLGPVWMAPITAAMAISHHLHDALPG